MFAPRHIHRVAVGCGLVCVLLLAAVMSPPAAANPGRRDECSAAARHGARGEDIALAQERYLSSCRESGPLAPLQPRVASDDTPWLPIAATLAIVSAGAARLCQLGIGHARAARAAT